MEGGAIICTLNIGPGATFDISGPGVKEIAGGQVINNFSSPV